MRMSLELFQEDKQQPGHGIHNPLEHSTDTDVLGWTSQPGQKHDVIPSLSSL